MALKHPEGRENLATPAHCALRTLFTIGHSTRAIEEFLGLLGEHGIRHLVDVRRYPGSKRYPQYGREALELSLTKAGVSYRHAPELGGRRQPLPGSPNDAWRNSQFRGYADHMMTPEARDALDRLIMEAVEAPTAVMCAEAVPWRCHRMLLSDQVVALGGEVLHIMGPGQIRRHELTENARRLDSGLVIYPGLGEQLGLGISSAPQEKPIRRSRARKKQTPRS